MAGGRPTGCTEATTARVCAALAEGASIVSACVAAGIAPASYHEWHRRSGEGPPFSEFAARTNEARGKGEASLEGLIRQSGADGDWRAAAWLLERMHPDRWSRRSEVTGRAGGPVEVASLTAQIDAALQGKTNDALGIPAGIIPDDGD